MPGGKTGREGASFVCDQFKAKVVQGYSLNNKRSSLADLHHSKSHPDAERIPAHHQRLGIKDIHTGGEGVGKLYAALGFWESPYGRLRLTDEKGEKVKSRHLPSTRAEVAIRPTIDQVISGLSKHRTTTDDSSFREENKISRGKRCCWHRHL